MVAWCWLIFVWLFTILKVRSLGGGGWWSFSPGSIGGPWELWDVSFWTYPWGRTKTLAKGPVDITVHRLNPDHLKTTGNLSVGLWCHHFFAIIILLFTNFYIFVNYLSMKYELFVWIMYVCYVWIMNYLYELCMYELFVLFVPWNVKCSVSHSQVDNFTVSFCDGRAFCYLVHHYHPELISASSIRDQTTHTEALRDETSSDAEDSFDAGNWSRSFSPSEYYMLYILPDPKAVRFTMSCYSIRSMPDHIYGASLKCLQLR